MWIRISLEALSPNIGRSCIRITLDPCRAAAIEATRTAIPPPTTHISDLYSIFGNLSKKSFISESPYSVN
ncbi:MAG: hypothetical protein ACTSWY_03755 [Promethearchaeota archaeon]